MNNWIKLGAFVCFFSAGLVAVAGASRSPNVLLILADDQGFCELGAYSDFADPATMGAKRIDEWRQVTKISPVKAPVEVCMQAAKKCMPNVDQLAAEGMRFTDFHAAPTCGPSRAALMTSRYPQGFGAYCNDEFEGPGHIGVPVNIELPVQLFKDAGYLTGLSGKWHLGHGKGQLPNQRGFDFFFGFDRAYIKKYGSERLLKNGRPVPAKGWLADQITDEALEFLSLADEQEKPFFLYVAYNEPHGPMPAPPKKYTDYINSGCENVDGYYGMIHGMDCGIGRILDRLKEMGELNNTLILYGSDNGQARGPYLLGFAMSKANPKFPDSGGYYVPVPGNGPLQGCKWTPWEGAVRVPFIVKMPGGVTGSSDTLLSIMDVMPTALDYAGIDVPPSMKLDGRSFLPELKGTSVSEKPLFWASDSQAPFIDKYGARNDALVAELKAAPKSKIRSGNFPPAWYVRTEKWKLVGWDTKAPVLFDMQNDIGETTDLAAQHPETVQKLKTQFVNWLNTQSEPAVYPESQFGKLKTLN